jgi:hypothetical protein
MRIGSLVAIVATFAPSLEAWNSEGHDAIGSVAMSLLESSSSSRLKSILGGEDASEVGNWAHRAEESVAWTKQLHFMAQTDTWSCSASLNFESSSCSKGHCLEGAVRHFYRQITQGEVDKTKNLMTDDTGFTDADAVRFIINLIGDLSQPLHVGFGSTGFGQNVYVRIPPRPGFPDSVVSLYEVWEGTLIDGVINNPYNPNFWWSGWTHYRSLNPEVVANIKKEWEEKGIDAISNWIDESAQYSCNKIYSDPITKHRQHLDGGKGTPIEISLDVYAIWERDMKERILVAGTRLGIVLNAVLANKEGAGGSKLRRGSALSESKIDIVELTDVFDDIDDRSTSKANPKHTKLVIGYNAGMLNIAILGVVVLLAVVAIKVGGTSSSSPSIKEAKSHIVEMVSSAKVLNVHRD